jgi:hypothetical protein
MSAVLYLLTAGEPKPSQTSSSVLKIATLFNL